jgi:hypothetical protein
MAPLYGMPPDPRPRKGTPEAIIREELERLTGFDPARRTLQPETPAPEKPASIKRAVAPTAADHRAAPRFARKSSTAQEALPNPERHARKCSICNHPERDAIDSAFLQWHSADSIALTFQILDRRVVFRHALVTGLYQRRRANFRCALESILERGDQVPLTAVGFVAAVRAYASLDEAGRWNEPPKRAIVTNEYLHHRPAEEPALPPAEPPSSDTSNPQILELETDLTHKK